MMPIKPENRARYPANWKTIVAAVRDRSGNRCEGSPMFPECRAVNSEPHPVTGSRVVLTTAHLDHVPENCSLDDLSNLRHWCQRCHLVYDAKHHARNAAETRRARKAIKDLFEGATS